MTDHLRNLGAALVSFETQPTWMGAFHPNAVKPPRSIPVWELKMMLSLSDFPMPLDALRRRIEAEEKKRASDE